MEEGQRIDNGPTERTVSRRRPETGRGGPSGPRTRGGERPQRTTSENSISTESLSPEQRKYIEDLQTGEIATIVRRQYQESGIDVEQPEVKEQLQAFDILQTAQNERKKQAPLDRAAIMAAAQTLHKTMPQEQLRMSLEIMFPDDKSEIQSLLAEQFGDQEAEPVSGEMDPAPVKELKAEVGEILREANDLINNNDTADSPTDEKTLAEGNALITRAFKVMGAIGSVYNVKTKNIPGVNKIPGLKNSEFRPINALGQGIGILLWIALVALLGITAKTTGRFAKR